MSIETALPSVGETAVLDIDITPDLVDRFSELVGDDNPIHMDAGVARSLGFRDRVAHGMSYACFLSTLIGTRLPGPGSLWASQTYRFLSAVCVGDTVSLRAEAVEVSASRRLVKLKVTAVNGTGQTVMEGESAVFLPRRGAAEPRPAPVPASGQSVALVAGAGGALGQAIARKLARDGFAVALCGRHVSRLAGLAEEFGPAAIATAMDLADEDSVMEAVAEVRGALGPPSLVVHCASASPGDQAPHETEWSTFQEHIDVQLGGVHRLLKSAVPAMLDQGGGQIVFIGSSATHGTPPRGFAAYGAAKSAAASLIKSIAVELAPRGIRANIISPHFMATDLTASVPSKQRKLIAAQTPVRRLVDVEEVAATVSFLASDKNTYINGHDLLLDGGAIMA